MSARKPKAPRCHFCGKPQAEVATLIASETGRGVICNECVELAAGLLCAQGGWGRERIVLAVMNALMGVDVPVTAKAKGPGLSTGALTRKHPRAPSTGRATNNTDAPRAPRRVRHG